MIAFFDKLPVHDELALRDEQVCIVVRLGRVRQALPALAMVLAPALLMVSTIRFRSVKAIDVGWRRSYLALFLGAVIIALIATQPRLALVVMAYTYLGYAVISWAVGRLQRRHPDHGPAHDAVAEPRRDP